MKPHLPLCLLGALLTAMTAVAMPTSYLADGVDVTDLAHSERFYDVGKGFYWTGTGEKPYIEAEKLYKSTGGFAFLGDLAPRIKGTTFSKEALSNLTKDDQTCGYQVPANQIQYWLSYYGVFYTGSEPLAYGYTYSRDYLEPLGGTLSLNVGMLFYDNWKNAGNNLALVGDWYFCGKPDSLLQSSASSGGYFADYFTSEDIVNIIFNQDDTKYSNYRPLGAQSFTHELTKGFALDQNADGSYMQTAHGQLVYLALSAEKASVGHAITCYGFETNDDGIITALKVVNSDDRAYDLFTLYLKENQRGYMSLYTDEACQTLWNYSKVTWQIEGLQYIHTPERLVDLYRRYTSDETELIWTGLGGLWSEESLNTTTDALPGEETGWNVVIGGQAFHSYYSETRPICFDDSAESTRVVVADSLTRSALMPAEMHLHNASKEYTFVGESSSLDSLMPQKLIIDGTGTANIRNLLFATDTVNYETYTFRMEQGGRLSANRAELGQHAVLELAGGSVSVRDSLTFGRNATLRVTETSSLSGAVTLQAGSVFDCVLTPALTDRALLTIDGSLTLGGTVKMEIEGDGLAEGTRYAICTVSSGSVAPEKIFTEHGSLSFSDNTLWLTYREVHSHTWSGGSCRWSATEFGNKTHSTLHADIVFDGGSGTITISGKVSPHHLVLDGGNYTFSGSGASIDCEGYVDLDGSAQLTLNVPVTAQGFMLRDEASLTFNPGKNSVISYLTATEDTQLRFLGPVTYAVEDTGVMSGSLTIGAGTSMEFALSHDVLSEGEVTALAADSSLLLYNSSASRQNVTCEAGTSLSRFQGSIKVGREGDARGTTLSVSAPPTVGQYIIASGSTLLINESGTVQGPVSGKGTLVLGPGADFKLDVQGGHTSFADSLALDVRGAAEIGTEEQRLSGNWTRELSVSGQLSMHVAGGTTLHYDKVTLDGGSYTYYTTVELGNVTHQMDHLHVGENGGTIARVIESGSAYPKDAGITQIGSLTGNGRLNLEGEHFLQMSYFAIDGVGVGGYTGEIHVTNNGAFSNDVYHLTVMELGAGLYDASVMLSNAVDNTHSRTALGLRGDVSLRGLESEPWGEAYLYSGSLRNTELDTSTPSPAGMIEEHAYTLSLVGNKDYHFSGEVLGPVNLLKSGKGTQSFRGDMSAFTGSATVSGGTLAFTHDVSLASALVEEKACLKGDAALNILGGLEMNSGVLTAQALTTTTASFSGQSVVKANSIQASGAWTLNVGLDNLHIATAELASLSGAGSLTLGCLDIRYQTADVASATYKLLTLSRDFESPLRALNITCNGSALSIGAEGSSPLYLQQTAEGGYDLLLDITDGTAPLPRGEYAELYWQAASGVWSLGTGGQSGVWESEHVNDNFHDGDAVYFTSAAEVSVSGKVAPVAIFVSNESGTVSFAAAKSDSAISGRGALTKEGAGQLVISLANTYTGGTTVKEGTLTVGNASALGTGVVKLEGGTLDTGSYAVKNAVTATGGTLCASKYAGQLTVAGEVTLGSALSATSLNLNSGTLHGDVSSGKVAVLNANGGALDGALTLNGGTLNLTAGTLSVSGTLTLDTPTRLNLSSFTDVGTHTLISAGSVVGSTDMLTYSSSIGRRGYAVSVSGGDLMLTVTHQADNHSWTSAKGTWTSTSVIGGKNYLDGDSVTFNTAAAVTVSGVIRPGDIIVDSAAKVTFTSDKKTQGSGFCGDGGLIKNGAGLLTMNAGNTYTGDTELNAGTLKATAVDSFGSGVIIVKGGTLDLGSKAVSNDIVLSGEATLKGDAKYAGNVTVEGDATLLAKTSYKGMTTIGTGNTLTLTPKATMAGSITIDGGELDITAPKGMTLAKNMTMQFNGGSVSGLLTIGTGSMLVWQDGLFETSAPVLKGGTVVLGGENALTLTGSKAQVQFGDKVIDLPGKGTVRTDEALTVNSGTVTVNSVGGYEGEIAVNSGTLKLSTGKLTTENNIVVNGTAAVVNGSTHYGDITVDGLLAKGTTIKLLDEYQKVALNGDGTMLGTISGKGIIDVNADINATAAKLTAATINLNSGTFTNTKGIKLAKGQTLTLAGASLDLGPKGALATVAGSTLVVDSNTTLTGSLTLGGGELVFNNTTLELDGTATLTLSKAMTVTGSGTIHYTTLKAPKKLDLEKLFGEGVELDEDAYMLTFNGGASLLRSAAAPLATAEEAPAQLDATPAIPVANPVADAMVQADWGILDAERAFMGAVNNRSQHAALLDKGRGAAWVSAFGASVRHGNQGMHHGSDGNIEGAAFGLEHAVSDTGTLGLAVGRSMNRLAATGVTHLRQETAHVALYGQKQLKHGFTADAAATYGDTETKLGAASWSQKSAALTARLTHAQQLTDATAFRTFGGLSYEATDAGSIGTVHTGSVQNLRAELGAGASHTAGKAHLYAEAALTGDMVRHNPTVDFGGVRTHGANPGRLGLRATVGGIYAFTDTWSGTASYGIEAESRSTAHTLNIGVSKSF